MQRKHWRSLNFKINSNLRDTKIPLIRKLSLKKSLNYQQFETMKNLKRKKLKSMMSKWKSKLKVLLIIPRNSQMLTLKNHSQTLKVKILQMKNQSLLNNMKNKSLILHLNMKMKWIQQSTSFKPIIHNQIWTNLKLIFLQFSSKPPKKKHKWSTNLNQFLKRVNHSSL